MFYISVVQRGRRLRGDSVNKKCEIGGNTGWKSGKTVERPLQWKTSRQGGEKKGIQNASGTCSSPGEGGSGSILNLPAHCCNFELD